MSGGTGWGHFLVGCYLASAYWHVTGNWGFVIFYLVLAVLAVLLLTDPASWGL